RSATRWALGGTRIMTTLVNALEQRGLQTMCEGGGMANATIIERLAGPYRCGRPGAGSVCGRGSACRDKRPVIGFGLGLRSPGSLPLPVVPRVFAKPAALIASLDSSTKSSEGPR